jgi:ABC-type nitrate/sulfonate/bicarbonate transport system permease component
VSSTTDAEWRFRTDRIRHTAGRALLPILGVASILVAVELASRVGLVDARFVPPVSTVAVTVVQELGTPSLWLNVLLTLEGWGLGLLIALLVGMPLGILCGLVDPISYALRPIIEFLRPVPSVALIPLAIIMLGAGMESKVFLAAFAATWPILVQTIYGMRDLDPLQFDVARSARVGTARMIFDVLIPSSLPYVVTGVRLASAIALALVVSTEIIIGAPGLGALMNVARASGNVPQLYALLFVTGCLGVLINLAMVQIERRLLGWHVSQREAVN